MADEQTTVIVAYEVNAEDVDRFLDAWHQAQDYLQKQNGFIRSRLYQAESANPRFRFINIGRWEDADSFRNATQDPEFQKASGRLAPYPVYASVYQVHETISADSGGQGG